VWFLNLARSRTVNVRHDCEGKVRFFPKPVRCPGRRRCRRCRPRTRVASFKLIDERRGESSSRRTEGVTDRDRATVDVYLFPIKAELFFHGKVLAGEGFVDLDKIDFAES
jgi:hypothetical protein